jgi:uncharacterized protein YaaR (DUF327 family)
MQSSPNNFYYPAPSRRRKRRLLTALFILLWLIGIAALIINQQALIDWWKLRGYEPPMSISRLADQTTMTDYGRKIFYVNRPRLENKSSFANSCRNAASEEQTIVLGCYHGGQGGIFLLSVTDDRLNGVQQVTAAHEMLHGAYERLDADEKSKIDTMLTTYYRNSLKDERVLKTIDAYKNTEPNDLANEMHSIFATEVSNLPAELESYYKKYFTNRAKVVDYAAQYQEAFTSRQAKLKQYEQQLAVVKSQINRKEDQLRAAQQDIETRQQQLSAQRESGNISAYNAGVASYNALVDNYNADIEDLKELINLYNQIVNQYNNLAEEQGQLIDELDSEVAAPINQ